MSQHLDSMPSRSEVSALSGNIADKQKNLGGSIAILCDGDTHVQIPTGNTYLYVINNTHGVADGLYLSNNGYAADAQITSSRVTAVSGGALNNFAGIMFRRYAIANGETKTFTVENSTRAILLMNGVANVMKGVGMLTATSAGSISFFDVADTMTGLTFDTSTANQLTIANVGTGEALAIIVMIYSGDITE